MSALWDNKEALNRAGVSLDASGANTAVVAIGHPAAVSRVVFVNTIAHTVADAVITFGYRNVDDTPSVTLGTFTLPFTGSATDDIKFIDIMLPLATGTVSSIDGSTVYTTAGKGPVYLEANDEMFFTSDGGGNAGTYLIYLQGWLEPFNEEVVGTELTVTAA